MVSLAELLGEKTRFLTNDSNGYLGYRFLNGDTINVTAITNGVNYGPNLTDNNQFHSYSSLNDSTNNIIVGTTATTSVAEVYQGLRLFPAPLQTQSAGYLDALSASSQSVFGTSPEFAIGMLVAHGLEAAAQTIAQNPHHQLVAHGEQLTLVNNNPVKTFLVPEHNAVINVTLPGHDFHPGIVIRYVRQDDSGNISVVTEGVGIGDWKLINNTADHTVWGPNALAIKKFLEENGGAVPDKYSNPSEVFCFAAGTPVDMADGTKKTIEQIKIGDEVMSYDPDADNGRGGLRPRRVTQTHATPNRIVLDFWGTKVTPGHVFLCGDGPYEGQHRMLIDIIRDDGAIVRADGSLVRAATNCVVGSAGDQMVVVGYFHGSEDFIARGGEIRVGQARAATIVSTGNGQDFSILDMVASGGFELLPNGLVVKEGEEPHPFYYFAALPKPEDYILKRSGVTLDQLYSEDATLDDDLRSVPAPAFIDAPPAAGAASTGGLQAAGNRRERRRRKAMARKHGGETIH